MPARGHSGPDVRPLHIKRVLVVNAYSTLNRGDAVILDGLIATLRAAGVDHIAVAAPTEAGEADRRLSLGADDVVPMVFDLFRVPARIRRYYPALAIWAAWSLAVTTVTAIFVPDSRASLRAYRDADLVISSGGAYLGGRRPGINLLTAFQVAVARLLRRTCVIAPITVKPMSSPVALIIRTALGRTVTFARDAPTVGRLQRIGIDARMGSDLAFRSPAAIRARAQPRPEHPGLVVAWAPRQFGTDSEVYHARHAIEAATADALTSLVRRMGARLLVIVQSNAERLENDLAVVERFIPQLPADVQAATEVLSPPATIEDAVDQYARADVLYASRLHAAILALMACTPSLVIDYEAKVRGVFGLLGLEDWVVKPTDAVDGRAITRRLAALARAEAAPRISTAFIIAERAGEPFADELARRLRGRLRA